MVLTKYGTHIHKSSKFILFLEDIERNGKNAEKQSVFANAANELRLLYQKLASFYLYGYYKTLT